MVVRKKRLKDLTFKKLGVKWNRCPQGEILRAVKRNWTPLPKSVCCGGIRKYEKVRAQLRMGWNCLNRTRKRFGWGSNKCPHCNQVEDRQHLLLQCQKYQSQRRIFFGKLRELGVPPTVQTMLGDTRQRQHVAVGIRNALDEFLSSCGRFSDLSIRKR